MKIKDILWVVVPILLLIALAFMLPLFTPESELPVWQSAHQYIFLFLSDTMTCLRLLFNYSFFPIFVQVILAFILKAEPLRKYITVMLAGMGAFVASIVLYIIFFGGGSAFNPIGLFILPLSAIPLVLTALILRFLSQHKHKNKILLITGIIFTVLPLLYIIYKVMVGIVLVSLSGSVAVIGGSDSLIMLFDLYAPHIRIIILGILLIILSLVLKKINEKSSEKQESVVE